MVEGNGRIRRVRQTDRQSRQTDRQTDILTEGARRKRSFIVSRLRIDSLSWEGESGLQANQSIMGSINRFLDCTHIMYIQPQQLNSSQKRGCFYKVLKSGVLKI